MALSTAISPQSSRSGSAQQIKAASLPVMGKAFMRRPVNSALAQARNKNLSNSDKPLAFQITTEQRTDLIHEVMSEFVLGESDPVKKLANALECSVGTAKNYLNGTSTPVGQYDDRACAVIPGYMALKAELAGMKLALDPRHQAKMVEMYRYMQMQADSLFGGATV